MKRLLIYLLLVFCSNKLLAQERSLQGVVFDRDSKVRLTRVSILNTRTKQIIFNTTRGEFKTIARTGDLLVAQLEGFQSDTVRVGAESDVVFYLRRKSIRLQEVVIKDTLKSPSARLQEIRENYKNIYRKGNDSDLLNLGSLSGAGVGLSIDALYSLFSKEGKNARNLQKTIDRDFKEMVIDYRYTPALVQQVIGLSGKKLTDFMEQYRPSYTFILEANDYELVRFIQSSYQTYLKNPEAYRLPPLK